MHTFMKDPISKADKKIIFMELYPLVKAGLYSKEYILGRMDEKDFQQVKWRNTSWFYQVVSHMYDFIFGEARLRILQGENLNPAFNAEQSFKMLVEEWEVSKRPIINFGDYESPAQGKDEA